MATYVYLDLNGLRKYDSLIKAYIADGDAKAIKFAKKCGIDTRGLYAKR